MLLTSFKVSGLSISIVFHYVSSLPFFDVTVPSSIFAFHHENGNDGCPPGIRKMFVGCCLLKMEILKCPGLGSFHIEKRNNLFISKKCFFFKEKNFSQGK
jgi:hypothetical protein